MARRPSWHPPYLVWRDGRPRWEPGPGLRRRGWKGRDLKDDAGEWLGLEAAIEAVKAINVETAARPRAPRRAPVTHARSVEALWRAWSESPEFRRLRDTTRYDYETKAGIALAAFGGAPVAALTRGTIKGFWRELYDTRGHHMANGVAAVLRSMLTFAVDLEWIIVNPALRMRLPRPDARLVLWTPEEVQAIVATADAMRLHSIGDAVVLALHSGQRQGDVIAMPEDIIDDATIRLSTLKTGARIDAPMTPQLAERMREARLRKRRMTVWQEPAIVIFEETRRPYISHTFRHKFAEVRAVAAETMPSIAGRRFQDLRDTAVTRLALAGCDLIRIRSITGHSPDSIAMIMRAYLALDASMARDAIDRLVDWMAREQVPI